MGCVSGSGRQIEDRGLSPSVEDNESRSHGVPDPSEPGTLLPYLTHWEVLYFPFTDDRTLRFGPCTLSEWGGIKEAGENKKLSPGERGLQVKPLIPSEKLDMVEHAREDVVMTSLIRNILDNYPAGSATLREFLQNTDDSGATVQKFILDARTFDTDKLVDPVLERCQGPAIIAVNNSHFLEKDWKAIKNISDSSKIQDETSTGKYGLGFRSCYHITDNPHVLSKTKLLILDPHQRVSAYPGGLSLPTDTDERQRFASHFQGFEAVFSSDVPSYDGTAIRLPLRLEHLAAESKIKSLPTTVDGARRMFQDFIAKELKESLLFLKHIERIELMEIDEDGNFTAMASVNIENIDQIRQQRSQDRGREQDTTSFDLVVRIDIGATTENYTWFIQHFVEDHAAAAELMSHRLDGDAEEMATKMVADKLLPHVALAYPMETPPGTSQAFSGRLFTLLPLPIYTGFPAHINGVLALTSSRQNLRNAIDITPGSREEFLVKWNGLVLSKLAPHAWACLLEHIATHNGSSIWSAWPQVEGAFEGDRTYWFDLPGRLLDIAGARPVWPVRVEDDSVVYQNLGYVLVCEASDSTTPVTSISRYGPRVSVVADPVYAMIKRSKTFANRVLTPQSAYPMLKANVPVWPSMTPEAARSLSDYLSTAGSLDLLLDLPIFPDPQQSYSGLRSSGAQCAILVTDEEAEIFEGSKATFILRDFLSSRTLDLLLKAPANVASSLRPEDVVAFLRHLFGHFPSDSVSTSAGVTAAHVQRLAAFWNWLGRWNAQHSSRLLDHSNTLWKNGLSKLHLLPLMTTGEDVHTLRKPDQPIVDPRKLSNSPELQLAFQQFGIPLLHHSVRMANPLASRLLKSPSDVHHILHQLSNTASFDHADQAARGELSRHFLRHLNGVQLPVRHRDVLRTLPIFPLLQPGPRHQTQNTVYGTALLGQTYFVGEDVSVVPRLQGISLIDISETRPFFSNLGGVTRGTVLLGEVPCLQLAISDGNWAHQAADKELSTLLVKRILSRLGEFPHHFHRIIADLPIVEVGSAELKPPSSVVDPSSAISRLYDPEDHVLPQGDFQVDTPGSYLQHLRNYGLLMAELNESLVRDMLEKLGDASRATPRRGEKALHLMQLLDHWMEISSVSPATVEALYSQTWLPVADRFLSPSECWDNRSGDADLCDLVKPLLPYTVQTDALRRLLQWEEVPFSIIQRQFISVLEDNGARSVPSQRPTIRRRSKVERVLPILVELGNRFSGSRCSVEDIHGLAEVLGSRAWVPVSQDSCMPAARSMISPGGAGARFYRVHTTLLNPIIKRLVLEMGVRDRPTPDMILNEIGSMANEAELPDMTDSAREELFRVALLLLNDILRHKTWSAKHHDALLLPTESGQLKPVNSVIFNDRSSTAAEPPSDHFFAHSTVSSSLATQLNLHRMSDEEFAQYEDEVDSFDLGEELHIRVQGVLKDYDMEYASSEWIANAHDAHAKKVVLTIDEATRGGNRLLNHSLAQFQTVPALIIYNDGLFRDEDWKGLSRIGTGGKKDTPEAIGRFGLGALSLYHFTEVPMVISGDSVLLLDPSQRYLPKNRRDQVLSGTKMPLQRYRTLWPDHLTPLYGLHGFNEDTTVYKGTIFRLPLRTAQQVNESLLSKKSFKVNEIIDLVNRYYSSADQSLFFSDLESIHAQRRRPDLSVSPLWSVDLQSKKPLRLGDGDISDDDLLRLSEVELSLRGPGKGEATETWLLGHLPVKTEDFPENLQQAFEPNRIRNPDIGVAFEITTKSVTPGLSNARLFATLPLPVSISLPMHLHAKWIMARDRRSLRYDAPDARGKRPVDALYNEYLLKNLFPGLYLAALEAITALYPTRVEHAWPSGTYDEISSVLAGALYPQLATTDRRVLRSVTDQLVTPSNAILHIRNDTTVRSILTRLRVENFVASLPFNTAHIEKLEGLTRDTPAQVGAILRSHQEAVVALFQASQTDSTDLDGLLWYLMRGKVDLCGLPLLQRGDGVMATFNSQSNATLYDCESEVVSKLLGLDKVIGTNILKATVVELQNLGLNVKPLDCEALREILRDCAFHVVPAPLRESNRQYLTFIKRFLKLIGTSPKLALERFEDLPLIPARHGDTDVVLSITRAQKGDVWWRNSVVDDAALHPVLNLLGFFFVYSSVTTIPRPHSTTIDHLLDVLQPSLSRLTASSGTIPQQLWEPFSAWIKRHLHLASVHSVTPYAQAHAARVQTLISLPLFEAYRGQETIPFSPASTLSMFPSSLKDSNSVRRWLPADVTYAHATPELQSILASHAKNRILDTTNIVRRLRLPQTLPEQEDEHYQQVMALILACEADLVKQLRFVPNQQRYLRRPDELYDHQEPLFHSCLGNRRHLFVHERFQQHLPSLLRLQVGIRSARPLVQPAELLDCIRAIDEDIRRGLDGTRDRAIQLWEYLNDRGIQGARGISLKTIEKLRFIPAHPRRHLSSHDLEEFALPKPDVVSPLEVYLEEHAPVLWTQRIGFQEEPSLLLRAVYQQLGTPSAQDVVNHLERLAVSAATSIPQQNTTVLYADVKKTYNWLQENKQATYFPLRDRSNCDLWLNVDDPKTDPWVWRNATQLVFDLYHDNLTDAGRFFNVRKFLMSYKDILLLCGAKEYDYPQLPSSRPSAPQAPYPERLYTALNQLRDQDALVDVYFVVDNDRIGAHRAALAAMIPHFLTAFTGSFRESQSFQDGILEYAVQTTTSVFAVRKAIDYAYTGIFVPPAELTMEDPGQVLEDLLELMGLANYWQMLDLKAEAIKAIVDLHLVRVETCDEVRRRAEECGARDLVKVCDLTRQRNKWAA